MSNVTIIAEDEPPSGAPLLGLGLHEVAHHFGIGDERLVEMGV